MSVIRSRALWAGLIAAAVCLAALPPDARAQSTNATITGNVVDGAGGVVPGVAVTATNEQTGFVRSVVTGERGAYQLNALPPGTYDINIDLSGFAPQTRRGIVLAIGSTVTLNFTLELATVKESVVVTAEAPMVDTSSSKIASAITPRDVDNLPLVGRQFMDLADLAPGVSIDQTTANSPTDNVAFGGFGKANKSEFLEGMDIDDGDTNGGSALSQAARHDFSLETVQEFQVLSTAYSVEFGRSSTGVLNILTKSGTNTFRGRGFYFLRDHSFQKPNAFAQGNPPFREQQSGGTLGGPIRHDQAWFFVTYENNDINDEVAVKIPSFVTPIITDPRTNIAQPVRKNNVFSKVTMSLSPSEYLNIIGLLNRETLLNQDVGGALAGDAGDNQYNHDGFVNAALTSTFSNNVTNELKFAVSDALKLRVPDGPLSPEVDFPSISFGTHTNYPQNRDQKNVTLMETLHAHRETRRFGTHDVKLGGTFNHVMLWNYHQDTANGLFTFLKDQLPIAGDPSTDPVAFVIRTSPAGPEYINPSQYAAFAEDAWRPRTNLTITAGLRWDGMRFYDNGAADLPSGMPLNQLLIAFVNGTLPQVNNYKPFPNSNDLAPRASIAWDPAGNGKTVLRGGFGLYYGNYGDNTASRTMDAYPHGSTSTFGNDVRLTGIPNAFFPGVPAFSSLSSEGSASIFVPNPSGGVDPVTEQLSAGVNRQIGPTTSVSVDYLHMAGLHFLMTYNINARLPNGTYPLLSNGLTMNFNDPSARINSNQIQFAVNQRMWHNLFFQASYTYLRYFEYTSNPVDVQNKFLNNYGSGPNDVRHRVVVSGTYGLPFGFQLGAIVNATSAPPYNIITGVDTNGDRNVNDRPIVNGTMIAPYSGRGDTFFRTDMRVSRRFKISDKTLELLWEMNNVFNTVNYGGYIGNMRSKLFGQPTFALTPFQGQLGVRFDF